MKKIVFLHPSHWEQTMGGAELQISFLAKYLLNYEYIIHFIFEDNETKIITSDNFILHPLKKIKIKKTFGNFRFLYRNRINELLREIKPDAIYTRSYNSWSGIASLYANDNNIKHIWAIAHDTDVEHSLNFNMIYRPFNFIQFLIANKVFKLAKVIIAQNDYQKNRLLRLYGRTSDKILQMGLKESPENIRKSKEIINVLWIANLKIIKHPEYFLFLVEALSNFSNCNFLMIGRPNSKYQTKIDQIEKNISRFRYFGELNNEKVNKLLCKSHILINTSDAEGFSNTFIQAWMRGVVVLTMNANPDNIITKEKIGFVCPSLDELVEKTDFLIRNNKLRKCMSKKVLEYARENHSIDKNMNKVMGLIK